MSIFNRLINLTRATAHEVLNKLENPTLMMNHYLRTMEEELNEGEQALRQQQVAERGLKARIEELERLQAERETAAVAAIADGREADARLILEEKLAYAEKAKELIQWHTAAKLYCAELEQQLEQSRVEYGRMKEKRNELAARVQKAASHPQVTMPSFTTGFDTGSAARGFERMEEKINQWEAQIELNRSHGPRSYSAAPYGAYGTATAAAETAPNADRAALIEDQLEQLRKKAAAQ